jgi:hypothetical protein
MTPDRKALFMCAAHCQGGHSQAGDAAAEALGVPFPLTMDKLVAKARSEGADPTTLWPWLVGMARGLFTTDELARWDALAAAHADRIAAVARQQAPDAAAEAQDPVNPARSIVDFVSTDTPEE